MLSAPEDPEHAAALAALLDADAAGRDLEAKRSVARALLGAIKERHHAQADGRREGRRAGRKARLN